jgi:hypothetical protein
LEAGSVPNGFVPITHGISAPAKFPTVKICGLRANTPSHNPTASVTRHLCTNEAGILQELDCNIPFKVEIHKEQPVRSTALTQHGSSERRFRRQDIVKEALLVAGNNSLDIVDHDAEV